MMEAVITIATADCVKMLELLQMMSFVARLA